MNWPKFRFSSRKHDLSRPTGDTDLIQAIPDHFEPLFGEVHTVYHEIVSDFIHLDLYYFSPNGMNPYHTFVTSGMAEKPMNVPPSMKPSENFRYTELILHLPAEWPISDWSDLKRSENFWPIQVMKSFARLPHEREAWVWFGHTMSNGEFEPFARDTKLSCALLGPGIQLGEEFETLQMPDGRSIVFLTLLFIYMEECQFIHNHGIEGFFQLLDETGMDQMDLFCLNKHRQNLCA